MALESLFQSVLIEKISERFPGVVVLKNDENYIQGIPDLLVLYRNKWAALECKKSPRASFRPNQVYYINMLNDMSYARVVYPENMMEVLDELQQTFEA